MIIEIYKNYIREYGFEGAIKEGLFTVWTDKRIKSAFNSGNGTKKDLERFMNDNKCFCRFVDMPENKITNLYSKFKIN